MLLGFALTGAAPPPPVTGLSARGSITASATFSGTSLPIGGTIALYQRGSQYRLDILSLGFPGVDPAIGALATQFLVPGGVTALFDGGLNTYTVYSTANRRYYQGSRTPAAVAQGAPAPPLGGDPFGGFGAIVRNLDAYQAFSLSTTLLGRSAVNGHPATRIDINLQDQRTGGSPETIHLQVALADDLNGFPVQIAVNRTGNGPTGSARIDVTSVDRTVPNAALLAMPAGFTRTDDVTQVFRPPGL